MTAACIPYGADYFVPRERGSTSNGTRALAARVDHCKTICAGCDMRTECLEDELEVMRGGVASVGVFGGTTVEERRVILGGTRSHPLLPRGAKRQPIKHGSENGYRQHRTHGIVPCPECLVAHNETTRQAKARARLKVVPS